MKPELETALYNYLPHKLKVTSNGGTPRDLTLKLLDDAIVFKHNIKPILRSISDLTKKEILSVKEYCIKQIGASEEDWKVLWHYLGRWDNKKKLPFWMVHKLCELHIDLFGLIEQELANDMRKEEIKN